MNELSDYRLSRISLGERNVGFVVVRRERPGGPVGFYIPKLMSEIEMGDGPWVREERISGNFLKNDNFSFAFPSRVKVRNWYEASPLRDSNMEEPYLDLGEPCWLVFVDGDIKKAYFENRMVDESRRRDDRVRIFVQDRRPGEAGKQYELLMDSSAQVIRISLENGRGEASTFVLEMDGRNGTATLRDAAGNRLHISTSGSLVSMENASGSFIRLSGKDVHIHGDGNVRITGSRIDLN